MREFLINSNDAGQRLDKFVLKTVRGIPVSLVYKSIRIKKIKVNRKRATEKQILLQGDLVQMFLAEDLFSDRIEKSELLSVKPNLCIAYEDENLIICDKPVGVLVHSGDGDGKTSGDGSAGDRNTLIYHIQAYLAQKGEYNPSEENSFAPSLCNRIDRNTGGLVIAAKNASALRDINARIRNGGVGKIYICAVCGKTPEKSDTLKGFLQKNAKNNKVKVTSKKEPGAKEIATSYSLIDYNAEKDISLVLVRLHTGRTHQIRAHMASIGCPLLGDGKYADVSKNENYGYTHQALYAVAVLFCAVDDSVSYLNGKAITADTSKIKFIKEFPKFSPEKARKILIKNVVAQNFEKKY